MWYHYIGIGGVGMSALAAIMLSKGYQVTGSDLNESSEIKRLIDLGAKITIGHKKENIQNPDLVVYSSAIKKENPERVAAREKGIKEIHRSENLAELINNGYGIAIAGSHGKTTTSALTAYMLMRLKQDPTAIIGGFVPQLNGNYLTGKSELVVAESDESDGSFLHYYPRIGSVSSVDADHLENFQLSYDKLFQTYAEFVTQIKDLALICADDPKTESLIKYASAKVLTYGLKKGDLQAYDIKEGKKTFFKARLRDRQLGSFALQLPGKYNVANALCAIGIALELNLDLEVVRNALADFTGTGRRFEKRYQQKGLLIIDDYGHHPTEIKATIDAARHRYPGHELWLAFQPHRYNRTKILWHEFVLALAQADQVVVLGIYAPPPEEPLEGISGQKLALEIQKLGKPAYYAESLEEAATLLKDRLVLNSSKDTLLLTMGAGTITKLPDLLQDLISS
mgnify:CR=1 FL=1